MKHFLGNLDVESISKGEHPDFSALSKLGMIIRGALNKKLANGLRFTTEQNKWLTEHYYNYPNTPEGFDEWSKKLHSVLDESSTKLKGFQN
jgi:regulatory protein YycI of two-component signal transduction system YycFG